MNVITTILTLLVIIGVYGAMIAGGILKEQDHDN